MSDQPTWARGPVLPVVSIDDAAVAPLLAEALLAGGVDVIEVTLRTPAACDAIAAIRSQVPQMHVGAGTIVAPADVDRALSAGAQFLVSPGSTAALRGRLLTCGVPALPGAGSVSEAMTALADGFGAVKLFPVAQLGGVALVRAVSSVLPHLLLCPTGGLDPTSAAELLHEPAVVCVGGSWLAPKSDIAARNWGAISTRARASLGLRPARHVTFGATA